MKFLMINAFFSEYYLINFFDQLRISKIIAQRLHGIPDFVKKLVKIFLFTFFILISNLLWLFLVVISSTQDT